MAMKSNDLKKLSRADLIEIIYQLQINEKKQKEKLDDLQEQLNEKQMKISSKVTNVGSIAEAVIGLSDIFEIAQKTADQYIDEVKALATSNSEHADSDSCIQEAQQRASHIVDEAEKESRRIIESAGQEAEKQRLILQAKTEELLKAHSELRAFLRR